MNFLLQSLCEALATLPHLVNLDVHGNLITAAGLSRLAESLKSVTGLKNLQRLDLSFNPLGNGASYPLTTCIQHTSSISSLRLESCDLTDGFLDDHIKPILKRRQLEEMAIGWNDWSTTAVKSWLDVLDLSALKRLSLIGTNKVVGALVTCIQAIDSCGIVELDLSHCQLTDSCVDQLAQSLDSMPQLKKLVLKNNSRLSVDSFIKLLNICRSKCVHLKELDLLGCVLIRSGDESVDDPCVHALQAFLAWSKSLTKLSLSFSRRRSDSTWINSLTDIWLTAHGHDAVAVQPTEHQLILTLSKL